MKISTAAQQQYAKFARMQKGQALKKAVDDSNIFDKVSQKSGKGVKMDEIQLSTKASDQLIQKTLFSTISEEVNAIFSEAGIEIAEYSGMDFSAKATAERIFSFTTSFYDMYKGKNPEMSEEEVREGFEKLVRGSVDKGYEEAMGLLSAHELDKDSGKDLAAQTMSTLHSMLDEFFANLRSGKIEGDEMAE